MLKKPSGEGSLRSSTLLAVSPAALYYRGASLPPSPVRNLATTTLAPALFSHEMAEYGTSSAAAGSSVSVSASGSALGLSLDSHKTRERSLPPPVSKAHRVLGHDLAIATQPRRHTYPDDLIDDDDDDDDDSVAIGNNVGDNDDDNDDDRASFVDFGSDENQPTARPFSITSVDSAIPTFAAVATNTQQRRLSPSSPTAIIPTFSASAVLMMSSRQHQQPAHRQAPRRDLPPTTNMLSNADRTDLLRKHKKLAQVLGESVASVHPFAAAEPVDTNQWPPLRHRDTIYVSASQNSRRHSAPLSPSSGQLEFLRSLDSGSRTSFVDMDDEDTPASVISNNEPTSLTTSKRSREVDSMVSIESLSSAITASTTATASSTANRRVHRVRSISVDLVASPPGSPLSWMVIGQQNVPQPLSEEERRQKRAKLVKLHRFLGSRVPPELVLGIRAEDGLPPVAQDEEDAPASPVSPGRMKATWMHIRRSTRGSGGSRSGSTSPALELDDSLNASELDDRERMINVKRAHKMEKVYFFVTLINCQS